MIETIPNDLLIEVLCYLDAKSITQTEVLNQSFLTISRAPTRIWRLLLQSDFLSKNNTLPHTNTKKLYIERYNKRKRYITISIGNAKRLALLQDKSEEHFRLRHSIIPLTSYLATATPMVLLLIFTSMLMNKLNNGTLKDVPYFVIFIPIWLFILIYMLVFAVTCFAAKTVNRLPENSGWRGRFKSVP